MSTVCAIKFHFIAVDDVSITRPLVDTRLSGAVLRQNIWGGLVPPLPASPLLTYPFSPFPFPVPRLPSPQKYSPINIAWGSAVSSRSGVWDGAPAEIEFCAF